MSRTLRANLLLLMTAFIWGVTFVAQDVAMNSMEAFTFNGIRMGVAGLALLPCIAWLSRSKGETEPSPTPSARPKPFWLGGLCCGVALFLGSTFQQLGIVHSTPGKAGFITALYIVWVPLTGLLRGRRIRPLLWLAVAVCTLGLFLLCVTTGWTISLGDLLLVLCAFCFTGHILVIDFFASRADCLRMSCVQFFVCSALCLPLAFLLEKPTVEGIWRGIGPILFAGVLSGAVGYTLQILCQRDTNPTVASLILCLESVFAVLAGWVLLGDTLSAKELLGCVLMLTGIVLAQLPAKKLA